MSFPKDLKICDPHFHVWDVSRTPNPNLGDIVTMVHPVLGSSVPPLGIYPGSAFKADTQDLPYAAALHVEACVGQVDGGHKLDTLAETRFVLETTEALKLPVGIVAFVQLGREDASSIVEGHKAAAKSAFRGVRMILNYSHDDPSLCWPQVGTDEYLKGKNETFNKNFALLAANGLVFDLHCNWFQLADAATFLSTYGANTTIVLDHLGVLKLSGDGTGEENEKRTAEWKAGLTALAANKNVNIKISGLEYILAGWTTAGSTQRSVVQALVSWVVSTFGTSRCLVASNWPVDLAMGKESMPALYGALHELLASHSFEERSDMFYGNAMRVYGMDKL